MLVSLVFVVVSVVSKLVGEGNLHKFTSNHFNLQQTVSYSHRHAIDVEPTRNGQGRTQSFPEKNNQIDNRVVGMKRVGRFIFLPLTRIHSSYTIVEFIAIVALNSIQPRHCTASAIGPYCHEA